MSKFLSLLAGLVLAAGVAVVMVGCNKDQGSMDKASMKGNSSDSMSKPSTMPAMMYTCTMHPARRS